MNRQTKPPMLHGLSYDTAFTLVRSLSAAVKNTEKDLSKVGFDRGALNEMKRSLRAAKKALQSHPGAPRQEPLL